VRKPAAIDVRETHQFVCPLGPNPFVGFAGAHTYIENGVRVANNIWTAPVAVYLDGRGDNAYVALFPHINSPLSSCHSALFFQADDRKTSGRDYRVQTRDVLTMSGDN